MKRHTRLQTRNALKRYALRGRRDALLADCIDREDLAAREFLVHFKTIERHYVRLPVAYKIVTVPVTEEAAALREEYQISRNRRIGRPLWTYYAERANRDWRWAIRSILRADRRQNRARRQMADRALMADPFGNDTYIPVRNWLN